MGHISGSESGLKLCPLFGFGNWTFSKVSENDCNLLVLKIGSRYTPIQVQKMGFALVCFLSAGAFLRPESGHNFGDQRHNLVTRKCWPPTRKIFPCPSGWAQFSDQNMAPTLRPFLGAKTRTTKPKTGTVGGHHLVPPWRPKIRPHFYAANIPAAEIRVDLQQARRSAAAASGRRRKPPQAAAAGGRRRWPPKGNV